MDKTEVMNNFNVIYLQKKCTVEWGRKIMFGGTRNPQTENGPSDMIFSAYPIMSEKYFFDS